MQDTIVHIGAPLDRLLVSAELMELKKPYQDIHDSFGECIREICIADLKNFKSSGSCAECFIIIMQICITHIDRTSSL